MPNGGGEISSNVGDLLAIGGANAKGVKIFGSMVGAVADFAGAVTGVGQLVNLIVTTWSGSQSDLDQIKDAIAQVFDRMNERQKAKDTSDRITNLENEIAPAAGVADGLERDVEANLTQGERNQRIETCAAALEALSGNAWFPLYVDQVYWNDWSDFFIGEVGYGYSKWPTDGLAPTAPGSRDEVFNYIYVLPAYLRVVALVLAEIVALDPAGVTEWNKTVLSPAVTLLETYHDKIANEGITLLSPSPWSGSRDQPWDPLLLRWPGPATTSIRS
jgi:hypothetical protein